MTSTGSKVTGSDLKRLGFVRDYSSFYYAKSGEIAGQVYAVSKQYAPKSLLPRIDAAEDTISQYSSPALAQLQDRSDGVLKGLDSTFDYTLKTANNYYSGASSNVSSVHKDNLQRFHSSRDAYFSKVQETVEYVKSHGLTGSARSAADSLLAQVEGARNIPAAVEKQAAFATEKVKEAWTNFQGLPIVQKILSDAQSTTNFAWQKYMGAHDVVLSHPVYHKAVQAGSESVSNIQGTSLYKNAKDRLYPSVAPYADPALDKLQANGYYKAAVDHLKPVNSNGKLT